MTKRTGTGIDWNKVDAIIFDVDGTLFDHAALRRAMLLTLVWRLVTCRLGWREIRTLYTFRLERERLATSGADNIGLRQFERVAAIVGMPCSEVEAIVVKWMYNEPLSLLPRYAFSDAICFIKLARSRGIRTGVFSDYPARDKLAALKIVVDTVCDATSSNVDRLKPDPRGFIQVAELLNAIPERCLVIGDRDDRDGEAARRGGFQFLQKTVGGRQSNICVFSNYRDLIGELERTPAPNHDQPS